MTLNTKLSDSPPELSQSGFQIWVTTTTAHKVIDYFRILFDVEGNSSKLYNLF